MLLPEKLVKLMVSGVCTCPLISNNGEGLAFWMAFWASMDIPIPAVNVCPPPDNVGVIVKIFEAKV